MLLGAFRKAWMLDDEILFAFCCGCWVIPLVVISIVYGFGQSLQNFFSTRGVERGGMYCAACRFDVRGATGENCPECGAYLLQATHRSAPRGGILVQGVDPPMGLGMRLLVYLVSGFAPLVGAVFIFGMLLPINYQHTTWVGLDLPNNPGYYSSVRLQIEAKRSWISTKRFGSLNCWDADYNTVQRFNAADGRDPELAEAVWDSIISENPDLVPADQREALRDEFVAVLLAACEFDEDKARGNLSQFVMDWGGYTDPTFHGLYILFGFVVVMAGLICLGYRVQRDHEASSRAFEEKVNSVQSRYRAMLAERHAPE